MAGSTLSDRLKNVEDEINEITSLMSLAHSDSKLSLARPRSLTNTLSLSEKSSVKSLNLTTSTSSSSTDARGSASRLKKRQINLGGLRSRSASRSDTNLKTNYSVGGGGAVGTRYSSDDLSLTMSNSNSNSNGEGDGKCGGDVQKTKKLCNMLGSSQVGDSLNNKMAGASYDSLQTFLHNINNSIIKGNQAMMSKIAQDLGGDCCNKSSLSAPCSNHHNLATESISYHKLKKEVDEERERRIKKDLLLEELKVEVNRYKEDAKKSKDMCKKYRELSEISCMQYTGIPPMYHPSPFASQVSHVRDTLQPQPSIIQGLYRTPQSYFECFYQLEKENKKQVDLLKAAERRDEEKDMELELYKQKYESVIRDLKMEQEHVWVLERDLQQLKECVDQTQLKNQELLGARTMAVELAHDLQKKHQTYVLEHQYQVQDQKNKITELEKLLTESIHEKNCVVERVHSLEEISDKYNDVQSELNEFKKKMADAEKIIFELKRNPEGIPQVKNILTTQEQTFKAALTEKATNEMALQAKYTTLEVELQLMQNDYNKRLQELEEDKDKLLAEMEKKTQEQSEEIGKLKLVTEELTELSNQYKLRISELSDINKHQEVLIKCQNEAISSKEERVKLTNQEADLNVRRAEQEKKSLAMEHEKSINSLRKLLEEEHDKLLVKEKIADDQSETIMQLRQNLAEKAKEVQRKTKEMQRMEQMLKQEKMEKDNLNCDVQHLKMHRARLNDNIVELQKQVDGVKINTNVNKKHSQMLEELEKKVSEKQKEWESEISKLKTERDQARETAQYAIENLSSAMAEYQKELSAQKTLQTKLAGLIREKEEQLNVAENRVKVLTDEIIDSERHFTMNRKNLEKKLAKARQLYTDAKNIVI